MRYLLILPSQGVLFCPGKGQQAAPISIHIFFPFRQGASKEYTMRKEIIKRVTKAGRNEALSFSSGFSVHTLQELKTKTTKTSTKKWKLKRKHANNEEFPAGEGQNNPGRQGHQGSIVWPKSWRPHSSRYFYQTQLKPSTPPSSKGILRVEESFLFTDQHVYSWALDISTAGGEVHGVSSQKPEQTPKVKTKHKMRDDTKVGLERISG